MLAAIVVASTLGIGGPTHAQPKGDAKDTASKKPDKKAGKKPGKKSDDAKKTEELPEGDDQVKVAPPPPEPKAGDQYPAPVELTAPPKKRRWISVGLDVASLMRPSGRDDVRYLPGLFWGGHVRAELLDYLGLRAYFTRGQHSVGLDDGALGPTTASQPNVTVSSIGGRLEPTLRVERRARLFLGLGVAWSRLVAPELETQPQWRSFERSGVFLEWTAALGALIDVIEDHAGIVVSLHAGATSNASGSAFDNVQAIDHNGLRARIGGLPISETTFGANLGVEAIF